MKSELAGKGAIITGGASGIGRATAFALLSAGASVAVLDRHEAGVNSLVEQAKSSGGNAFALTVDLADTKLIPDAVARAIEQTWANRILVNCAGVAGKVQSLLEIDEDNWNFVYTVNLKAPMLMMKEVSRHMIKRGGGGRIINISSSSAFRARNSPMAYASSKAALVQLTRSAAAELAPHDINVNAVAPGITATGMTQVFGDTQTLQRIASSGPWRTYSIASRNPRTSRLRSCFFAFPAAGKSRGRRSTPARARWSSEFE